MINILVDWLNVKRLHCRHSKIVKWLNKKSNRTYTLWESPTRFAKKKIGWGCMIYHIFFLKKNSQSSFSTKMKKIKPKSKSQKNRKKCHEHCTNFHCIALLHTKPAFIAFQDKGCMHLHPKSHGHIKCIDFSLYANFPKLILEFRIRDPLKESTTCFLTRLSPSVLVPIG